MSNLERQRRECQRQASIAERLFLPPDEFARRVGVSRSTIWRLMQRGEIRFAKFGRVRRIPVSECERLTTSV
jgi:excisionase family DNA binding protein